MSLQFLSQFPGISYAAYPQYIQVLYVVARRWRMKGTQYVTECSNLLFQSPFGEIRWHKSVVYERDFNDSSLEHGNLLCDISLSERP